MFCFSSTAIALQQDRMFNFLFISLRQSEYFQLSPKWCSYKTSSVENYEQSIHSFNFNSIAKQINVWDEFLRLLFCETPPEKCEYSNFSRHAIKTNDSKIDLRKTRRTMNFFIGPRCFYIWMVKSIVFSRWQLQRARFFYFLISFVRKLNYQFIWLFW